MMCYKWSSVSKRPLCALRCVYCAYDHNCLTVYEREKSSVYFQVSLIMVVIVQVVRLWSFGL
jgi:hypothetical protein